MVLTVKLFVMRNVLLGTSISPLPLARRSKLVLPVLVVIKLSSNLN